MNHLYNEEQLHREAQRFQQDLINPNKSNAKALAGLANIALMAVPTRAEE